MRARFVSHDQATGESRPALLPRLRTVVTLAVQATLLCAHALPSSPHRVAPAVQASRDSERVEILREELRKAEAQLQSLTRRPEERTAASAPLAASEADAQRLRTLQDITALRREIASATFEAPGSAAARPTTARPDSHRAGADKRPASTPWWDVYRSRRPEASAANLSASGQDARGARPDPQE